MFSAGGGDQAAKNTCSAAVSLLAGFLSGAGLWVYIDGVAFGIGSSNTVTSSVAGYSWMFPVLMLLAHLLLNGMSFSELVSDTDDSPGVATRARLLLILIVVIQCVVLAIACFVMATVYLEKIDGAEQWAGISLFVSQLLMAVAAWVQRLATLPPRE